MFQGNIPNNIHRKTIGIIEFKNKGSINTGGLPLLPLQPFNLTKKHGQPVIQSLTETGLLVGHHLLQQFTGISKVRVGLLHHFDNQGADTGIKRLQPNAAAKTDCPAHYSAQDITAPFIGRQYAIGNQKGSCPGMIGNNPHGHVIRGHSFIFFS